MLLPVDKKAPRSVANGSDCSVLKSNSALIGLIRNIKCLESNMLVLTMRRIPTVAYILVRIGSVALGINPRLQRPTDQVHTGQGGGGVHAPGAGG